MAGLQGRMFGGYQLVEQFPAGGIADVYRGHPNKPGGREVVVKVVYPEFARQPGFLPRFRHIVEMSGRLASHPHVLPLLAHGEDAGYLYLVTPYVEAGTLRDWQRKGGRMSLADVGPFFRQLCDALGYAHSLGVVHGNLKPSNVFLFEGRHVLLGDFGMLWDVSHMDMNHAGSGTDAVEYLAPEVLGGQVTQLSDIYSLGAMLFSAAAGHAPFHGGKPADVFAAHARQPVPALAQANPALAGSAAALDPVIQRAMAKRPEDRFPSAAAVAQAIDISARQAQTAAVAPATAPVFGAAPVAPGFAPLSAGLPGMQAPQPPQQPMPIAPVFGAPAPAPFPGAAGMLGAGAGPAAAAFGSTLGQLDPPFPPLPTGTQTGERVERMEQRASSFPHPTETGTGIQATIRVPAPNIAPPGSDVPLQQTMHVPAPQPPAADASFAGLLESSPQLPAMPSVAASSSNPPGKRPYSISGAPAARLGSAGLAGRTSAPPFQLDDEDDEGPFGHQMLQAIRPGMLGAGPAAGGIPSAPGFAVAGGSASAGTGPRNPAPTYDAGPPSESAWTGEGSAFGPGASHEWRIYDGSGGSEAVPAIGGAPSDYLRGTTGWNDAPGGAGEYEASGWPGEQAGFGASQGGGYSEELRAQAPDGDGRPFSPTQLGLPRLTSPVLVEQPPSFHDILAESNQLPRFDGGVAVGERAPTWNDAGAGMWGGGGSAPLMPWRSNPPNGGDAGAGWEANGPGAWGNAPGMSGGMPPAAAPWDQPAPADEYASSGKRGKPGRFGRRAEPDDDSGFDDERVWTVGTTAVRAGRRRGVRKIALFLLLVLLVDMVVVVVARPDLCPTSGCKQVSAFIHQKVPFLHGASIVIPAPLVAAPTKLSVNAISGKTATVPFVLTNLGKADIAWKASVALSWLTLNPASGTLSAGAHQPMVVTAKPIGVKPGSYSSNVTVTTDKGDLAVPITIAVAAGALLTISPTSLTFTACGTAQPVTIKNAGAASLKFTAVPSQDSALSLDTTSGTLGPGQSRAISVTLLCTAVAGNGYTVNIISDSGSAVVTIHYT